MEVSDSDSDSDSDDMDLFGEMTEEEKAAKKRRRRLSRKLRREPPPRRRSASPSSLWTSSLGMTRQILVKWKSTSEISSTTVYCGVPLSLRHLLLDLRSCR